MPEIAFAKIKSGDRIRAEFTVDTEGWFDDLKVGDTWIIEDTVTADTDYTGSAYLEFRGVGGEYSENSNDGTSVRYFLLERNKPEEPTKFGALVKDSNSTYVRVMPSDDGGTYFVDVGDMSQNGIIMWDSVEDDVEILFTGVDLD